MPDATTPPNYGNRVLWVSILVSFAMLVIIINLVRKRHLSERFALVWITIPIFLFLFSSNRTLLEKFASFVGIYYPPAVMIPVLFFIFLIISLYFSIKVSKTEEQIKTLAQELALLKHKIEMMKISKKQQE